MKTVLIIGKTGQLAQSLITSPLANNFNVQTISRSDVDLTAPDTLAATIEGAHPDLIINAAAYTAVDAAESDKETAFAVNRDAVEIMGHAAVHLDVPIFHVSTDYVYAGDKDTPYIESDATDPKGVYGQSKLAGEQALIATGAKACIFRTAWVYSEFGNNFVKTMLRLGRDRDALGIVADQFGNPTYAGDLADGVLKAAQLVLDKGWKDSYAGIYHLAGTGSCSWFEFADKIFDCAYAIKGQAKPQLSALTTADYPTPAARPSNSRLDCARAHQTFDILLPDWKSATQRCIGKIMQAHKD